MAFDPTSSFSSPELTKQLSGAKKTTTATPKTTATKPTSTETLISQSQQNLADLAKIETDAKKLAEQFGLGNFPTGTSTTTSSAAAQPAQSAAAATQSYMDQMQAQYLADQAKASRQSAYDLLVQQFGQYGLGSLVEPLKGLIQENISPSEFALRLEGTEAYKKRFAANQDRIKSGLRALTPAEYIGLEDQYQNIMRTYGLPESYYKKGDLGIQEGFNKLLASDVSAAELEDRIATAQSRVINANPQVKTALKQFYPDITDGDILAYTLDPSKALTDIKRKVTAAEIGGAAIGQGLATSATEAEKLAAYGVTKQQATQGYQTIAEVLPTGQKLSQIYGETPYTQQQAEQEIFNLADAAEAARKRKRLTQLEQASFAGSSGISSGALRRERSISGTPQAYGAGQY